MNRRNWLATAMTATGAAGSGWAWWRQHQQTIRIGLIGCGMRGSQLARLIKETGWYDVKGSIVSMCDADISRAQRLNAKHSSQAQVTQDYRQVIDRDDLDAIFIATPDHWHARLSIESLQAGKHVYCEKPMTLTIAEGHQLIAAVKASKRTFQVGSQQRSHLKFQQACNMVRDGRLGQVRRIDITLPVNHVGGPFSNQPVPETLDWERWLGPAPFVDYCPERFSDFRYWYEYTGGTLADWGAHHLDIAHWAMELEDSGPLEISGEAVFPQVENGFNTPTKFAVEMKYRDNLTIRMRSDPAESGLLFEGDQGRIYVNRKRLTGKPVEDLGRRPLTAQSSRCGYPRKSWFVEYNASHILHFFDCILTGQTPISNVDSQHRSVSACHLANIALRLGRTIKWDPVKEQFDQDSEAAAMLSRPSRMKSLQIASSHEERNG